MENNVVDNISPVVDAIFNSLKPFCLPAKCFEKLTRSIYQLSYLKTTKWCIVNKDLNGSHAKVCVCFYILLVDLI